MVEEPHKTQLQKFRELEKVMDNVAFEDTHATRILLINIAENMAITADTVHETLNQIYFEWQRTLGG